jgi:hypothetical protein
VDERIRKMLKELGEAINESISGSADVNDHIQRIRDEGYNLYVVLDATIGLDKDDDEEAAPEAGNAVAPKKRPRDVQFRIDVNDLSFLKSLGIDPTRKVKAAKRLELPAPEPTEPS